MGASTHLFSGTTQQARKTQSDRCADRSGIEEIEPGDSARPLADVIGVKAEPGERDEARATIDRITNAMASGARICDAVEACEQCRGGTRERTYIARLWNEPR